MAKAKKKSAGKSRPAPAAKAGAAIRVRMYRVGFGDCFLLTLPAASGPEHVLIDCGVHPKGDAKTIRRAVENVAQVTGKRLAVVIATHAHADHISGFHACKELFRSFDVGEVWLPWTENPDDKQAQRYKTKQLALTNRLAMHLAALRVGDASGTEKQQAALYAVQNLTGNADALQLLNSKINGGKPRYLEAGEKITDPAGIKGLAVKVLGPPRDEKFLGQMDPPKGDRFLRLDGKATTEVDGVKPFARRWDCETDELDDELRLDRRDVQTLVELSSDPVGLAFALDHAVNNSSVVTLFSFAGRNLLFPGDAQYGNWAAWINDPAGAEILRNVNFLKVAHHGSHNATPKSALAKMEAGHFSAMVATQNRPWPSIPLKPLMAELNAKTQGAIVRSDQLHLAGMPDGPKLAKAPPGFSRGDFWFDCEIAL